MENELKKIIKETTMVFSRYDKCIHEFLFECLKNRRCPVVVLFDDLSKCGYLSEDGFHVSWIRRMWGLNYESEWMDYIIMIRSLEYSLHDIFRIVERVIKTL